MVVTLFPQVAEFHLAIACQHTRLASMVSMSMQEQRDLLELLVYSLGQLLVEPDFDVEELGEQALMWRSWVRRPLCTVLIISIGIFWR